MRKVMKDFPEQNQNAIVHKSVEHARCPVNPRNSVRVDMRVNGMIISEDSNNRGTKISWILSNDLRGSLPNSMLINLHVKYQTTFMENLTKACTQIVKGQLK